jgi:virginiamycin B lyase
MGGQVRLSRRGVVAVVSLVLASILFLGPEAQAGKRGREIALPAVYSQPHGITTGLDGNLWFTEYQGNKIGQMTTAGVVVDEFPIPTAGSIPYAITAGPDGNLWFTEAGEYYGNKIGRITTAGFITEFPIPTASSTPYGITAGPDRNLWFTESFGNKIGEIYPSTTLSRRE